MTKPRDPDIKALDHAIRALNGSTPRMLPHNLAFIVDKWKHELAKIGIFIDDTRAPFFK